LGSGDPCQLRRCDAGRVAASSSVAGIRAGGGGQSHAHSAPRGDQTGRTPPTSRRARPRVGAAQREVARRAAWQRSRPPTPLARRRPRGPRPPRCRPVSGWVRSRTGRQEEPAGARRAAGRRAPPVFNAGLFGVRVRRWLAVGHSPRDRTECGETSTIGDAGSWIRRRICALCLADPRVVSASGVSYDKSLHLATCCSGWRLHCRRA